MLYEISKEVSTELAAQGCPVPVVYGPERQGATGVAITTSRIVFERDRSGGDSSGPGRGRTVNPKMLYTRNVGAVCRVFAQSTESGARVQDHERLADLVWDKVEVALYKVIAKRKDAWRVASSKLLSAEELAMRGLEVWPGVVYEVRFTVSRGVYDTTWTEAAKPEASVSAAGSSGTPGVTIESADEIKLTNGPVGAPAETAC